MSHYIPIILGTAREGRNSEQVARLVLEKIIDAGYQSEIIDVKDYPLTHTQRGAVSPELLQAGEMIKKADAVVIVVPEYNHGYPGELKLFIDTFLDEYNGKPVAFVGTGGVLGGGRAVEQLRQVLVELNAYSTKVAMYFPMVWSLFADGKLKDPAPYDTRFKAFIEDIASHLSK